MNDVLLTAYLTALASDDLDTAREVVSLASDPEAVDALLSDDGVSESYTEDEYERLVWEYRQGLVKKQIKDKNGRNRTVWVRSEPKAAGKKRGKKGDEPKAGATGAADSPTPQAAGLPAGKPLDDAALDALKADYSKVPADQREAVKTAVTDYALGTSYTLVNGTLRGTAGDQGNYQKIIDRDIANLRTAFDVAGVPVPEDTVLYRGVGKMPVKLEPVVEFTDKGFGSTTADKSFADENFVGGYGGNGEGQMLEIVVPKGHKVLVPLGSSNRKKEVMLRDGTKYRVVSVDGNRVRVEVVGDSAAKESYEADEYATLSEAQKSLLVKQVVTDKNGKKTTRWVRAGGTMDDAPAGKDVQRAVATKYGPGVGKKDSPNAEPAAKPEPLKADDATKADPKPTPKKPSDLTYLPKDPKRVTIDQATRAMGDLGYTVVKAVGAGGKMQVKTPEGEELALLPAEVKRIIYGKPKKEGVDADDVFAEVEEYEADEYEVLSEADRAGLVLKQVGTHPKTGNPIMRYVRSEPKVSTAGQKQAQRAASKEKARSMIEKGITGPAQARVLAGHLKNITVQDAKELAAAHAMKTRGKLKADKVNEMVAYAQGRGSVPATVATVPQPAPAATPAPAAPAPTTPAGPVSREQVAAAVLDEFETLLQDPQNAPIRMVPIHQIRDRIRAKLGDSAASDAVFNAVLLDLRRDDKVRLVSITDRSRATPEQLSKSVFAVGETFFYVERA